MPFVLDCNLAEPLKVVRPCFYDFHNLKIDRTVLTGKVYQTWRVVEMMENQQKASNLIGSTG